MSDHPESFELPSRDDVLKAGAEVRNQRAQKAAAREIIRDQRRRSAALRAEKAAGKEAKGQPPQTS